MLVSPFHTVPLHLSPPSLRRPSTVPAPMAAKITPFKKVLQPMSNIPIYLLNASRSTLIDDVVPLPANSQVNQRKNFKKFFPISNSVLSIQHLQALANTIFGTQRKDGTEFKYDDKKFTNINENLDALIREYDTVQKQEYAKNIFQTMAKRSLIGTEILNDALIAALLRGESFVNHFLPNEKTNFINCGYALPALNELENMCQSSISLTSKRLVDSNDALQNISAKNKDISAGLEHYLRELGKLFDQTVGDTRANYDATVEMMMNARARANLKAMLDVLHTFKEINRLVTEMDSLRNSGDLTKEGVYSIDTQISAQISRCPGVKEVSGYGAFMDKRAFSLSTIQTAAKDNISNFMITFLSNFAKYCVDVYDGACGACKASRTGAGAGAGASASAGPSFLDADGVTALLEKAAGSFEDATLKKLTNLCHFTSEIKDPSVIEAVCRSFHTLFQVDILTFTEWFSLAPRAVPDARRGYAVDAATSFPDHFQHCVLAGTAEFDFPRTSLSFFVGLRSLLFHSIPDAMLSIKTDANVLNLFGGIRDTIKATLLEKITDQLYATFAERRTYAEALGADVALRHFARKIPSFTDLTRVKILQAKIKETLLAGVTNAPLFLCGVTADAGFLKAFAVFDAPLPRGVLFNQSTKEPLLGYDFNKTPDLDGLVKAESWQAVSLAAQKIVPAAINTVYYSYFVPKYNGGVAFSALDVGNNPSLVRSFNCSFLTDVLQVFGIRALPKSEASDLLALELQVETQRDVYATGQPPAREAQRFYPSYSVVRLCTSIILRYLYIDSLVGVAVRLRKSGEGSPGRAFSFDALCEVLYETTRHLMDVTQISAYMLNTINSFSQASHANPKFDMVGVNNLAVMAYTMKMFGTKVRGIIDNPQYELPATLGASGVIAIDREITRLRAHNETLDYNISGVSSALLGHISSGLNAHVTRSAHTYINTLSESTKDFMELRSQTDIDNQLIALQQDASSVYNLCGVLCELSNDCSKVYTLSSENLPVFLSSRVKENLGALVISALKGAIQEYMSMPVKMRLGLGKSYQNMVMENRCSIIALSIRLWIGWLRIASEVNVFPMFMSRLPQCFNKTIAFKDADMETIANTYGSEQWLTSLIPRQK